MIRLSRLSKSYGAVQALQEVSLEFPAGRCTALLGPSGSGKTTLLLLIAGLLEPDSGEVALGDRIASGPRHWIPPHRRNLGLVFQDNALWPHLSVRRHLEFSLSRRPAGERKERVEEMLEQLDLLVLQDRFPGELSGGEAKRLALARALIRRPAYLLLDEPFNGIDAERRRRFLLQLEAAVRETGLTSIVVSQHPEELDGLVTGAAILEKGRLIRHG